MEKKEMLIAIAATLMSANVFADNQTSSLQLENLSGSELAEIDQLIAGLQPTAQLQLLQDGKVQIRQTLIEALKERGFIRNINARAGGWTPGIEKTTPEQDQ